MTKKIKNILIITHGDNRHFYVCNEIADAFKDNISFVINAKISRKRTLKNIKKRFRKKPIKKITNLFFNIIFRRYLRVISDQISSLEKQYFLGNKTKFFKLHRDKVLFDFSNSSKDLNDPFVIEKIQAFSADIIIVFGADLVPQEIIESSKLSLNLHTGLSPYYRGGRSNFWPFMHEDWKAFGVTLHQLTNGIDSGDIVRTGRIHFTGTESYPQINCEAIILGTTFILEAINQVRSGYELQFVKQWRAGKLYNNIDFNGFMARKYCRLGDYSKTMSFHDSGEEIFIVKDGCKCRES